MKPWEKYADQQKQSGKPWKKYISSSVPEGMNERRQSTRMRNVLARREPGTDYTTGAPAGFRADFSRMDTDAERSNFLNQQLGQGNWDKDEFGAYRLSPEAAQSLGIQTDKPVALDEQDITFRDIADWGGDAPAIAGALATAPLTGGMSLPLGLATTGLGAFGGKMLGEVEDYLKGQNLQTLGQVADDAAVEGLLASLGEGGARALGAVGRKALAPQGAKYTDEVKALQENAKSFGLKPNFAQLTDPLLSGRMMRIGERLFGDPNSPANYAAIQKNIDQFKTSFGKAKPAVDTGETVASSIKNRSNAFWKVSKDKYGKVDEIFEGKPVVPTSRLKQAAGEMFDQLPKAQDGSPVFTDPQTQQFINQVMSLPDNITTKELQAIRKRLFDAGYDDTLIPGLSGREARSLAKAAGNSFDDIAANLSIGVDDAQATAGLKALKDAQKFYRENVSVFDDQLVNKIVRDSGKPGSIDPEMVVDTVFKRKNVSRINRVKKAMKTEDWQSVQARAMEDMMDVVSQRTENPMVSMFQGGKLHDAMDRYGDESLKAMFGAKKVKEMRNFANAIQTVSRKMKDQGGLVAAGIAARPLQNLGRLAQMKVLQKFMFSDAGLKYFTEGIKAPKTRAGAAALTRVSTMLTALAEDETGSPFISYATEEEPQPQQ